MANLSIRNIDDITVQALRIRAAKKARSMEEEIRQILDAAVRPDIRLGDLALELFADIPPGQDIELPSREHAEPPTFE